MTEETLQHSIETLQHTEVKEANILPDKYDLLKERIEDNLAQDVQSFDTASLKTVTTYESSGIEMFKVHFFPFGPNNIGQKYIQAKKEEPNMTFFGVPDSRNS